MKEYGLKELREEIMEGIEPNEEVIGKMPLRWRATKHTLILDASLGGLFSKEIHADPAQTISRYAILLEKSLFSTTGIDVRGFKRLRKEDWEILDCMIEKEETATLT
ncbi:MAG: hypothetical protein WC819_00050 [Parcubacteria group bacterium]